MTHGLLITNAKIYGVFATLYMDIRELLLCCPVLAFPLWHYLFSDFVKEVVFCMQDIREINSEKLSSFLLSRIEYWSLL